MKALALLIAGWLAAIAVVAALVVSGREAAIERGARSSEALAQVMEEHTARTFQAVDITLEAAADAWALTRPRKHDPAFHALLQRRLDDLPYVRALFAIGADGFLIHDTDYPRTPDVSLADRDYFQVHRDDPGLRHNVSGPVLSRGGAGWFVSVTERLGAEGKFQGILVAALQPAYFEALYRRVEQGEDEGIALLHRDGTMVARYPAAEQDIGKPFLHLPLFQTHLARAPNGNYRADDLIFPGNRLVSYRSIEGLPLVVQVSRSEHAVLAEWRRSALGAGVAMGALTLLLGGVLVQQLRARRRREYRRTQRAQADKLEALGQLTGGISHDFANLLSIISMNLDLILRKRGDAEATQRAAMAARRAVERGSDLIRRLLAFARRQPLELKAADLNSLLAEAHPLVAQAAGARIELVLQLTPDLPPVLVDEAQFEMALLNLVVNARDALSGRGRIVLHTHAAPGGDPCLTVEDNGPGMGEEIRRRALEPFFTTKGQAGTGLGLPQVYGFLQQIGGGLEIDSAPGKGTRVEMRFPRAPALTEVKAGG
ncbi:MAG TPA: ATP-binding protein [Burkholderiales bacterium]